MTNFREADIFWWRYKDQYRTVSDPYWCKSMKAVVDARGNLCDTYWGDTSHPINPDIVELTFKGNVEEFYVAKYGEERYFENSDKINMQHANDSHGKIYIRKGATRSREIMMACVKGKLDRAQSALRSAEWDIEQCQKKIVEIDSADSLDGVWI